MAEIHKVELSSDMVARVMKRRGGKLHAFDRLDPLPAFVNFTREIRRHLKSASAIE